MGLSANTPKYFRWTINTALGVVFLLELFLPNLLPDLNLALIALAAVASVASLQRQLPLQNVLPAALITACIGGMAHGLSAQPNLAIPFGPIAFNSTAGAKIFGTVPWTIPLLWIVVVFNSRGVARLVLRPWRKVKNYGFWLIGLTAALAVAFDLALEPFAWHAKHLWLWKPTKIPIAWYGATPLNFIAWAFVSLFIMMFVTPLLIKKQPGNPSAPDFHPLAVWIGALLLFAVGSAGARLWWTVGVDAVIATVTMVLAIRGARW